MKYQTPKLSAPAQMYEAPLLVDLAAIAAELVDVGEGDCNNCGTGGCTPKPETKTG